MDDLITLLHGVLVAQVHDDHSAHDHCRMGNDRVLAEQEFCNEKRSDSNTLLSHRPQTNVACVRQ
jgi:hypothetical protein